MKKTIEWFIRLVLVLALGATGALVGALHAQSTSITLPNDQQAFFQGQLDAEQAQVVGGQLSSYCNGYASVTRYMNVVVPVQCDEFWTYEDIYGPMYWYPRVYIGIRGSFYGNYGHYRQYGWMRHDGHGNHVGGERSHGGQRSGGGGQRSGGHGQRSGGGGQRGGSHGGHK